MNLVTSIRVVALAASAFIVTTASAAAPAPEVIFANQIKAMGGEDAIRATQTRFMEGTLENKAARSVSRLTFWQKAPNLSRTEIETLGSTLLEQGYDGTNVWATDGKGGLRAIEKNEAAAVIDSSMLQGDLDWKKRYSEVKTVGEGTFAGKPAIEVAVKTPLGISRSLFFDPTTWLQLGTREAITATGPDGKLLQQTLTTTYDEFKPYGGVQTVVRFTQKVANMELVTNFSHVEVNGKINVDFVAPAVTPKSEAPAKDDKAAPKADAGAKAEPAPKK